MLVAFVAGGGSSWVLLGNGSGRRSSIGWHRHRSCSALTGRPGEVHNFYVKYLDIRIYTEQCKSTFISPRFRFNPLYGGNKGDMPLERSIGLLGGTCALLLMYNIGRRETRAGMVGLLFR